VNEIDWDAIFAALNAWRDSGDTGGIAVAADDGSGGPAPSVTTVAERYRRDPWAVLVSTIISLRTKDEVTLVASGRLLARAGDPAKMRALDAEEIGRLIYPAGFYRTKAATLRNIAAILLDRYGGVVPSGLEELLALPGVGRKTANLVRIEAFDLDGICVDTHVHRSDNRAGWLCSKSPDETEMILRTILPRVYWKGINALLVLYGQRVCRPISPFCSRCVISAYCRRCGVDKCR
jgi:endonuclease-3